MIAKWGGECPACHQPIERGTELKRYIQRVGGWGPEGHWQDTGTYCHVDCPKVKLPRRSARVSSAQVLLDYDEL